MSKERAGSARPITGVPSLGWFHRYPARFSNSTLAQMLSNVRHRLGHTFKMVLDPFAGTGSTLAAARGLGIESVGIELTPLGCLIAEVRLNPPSDLNQAVRVAELLARISPTRRKASLPKTLIEWIGHDNASVLNSCALEIENVTDTKMQDWLRLAISSALRASSCWLPGSIKAQRDPDRVPPPIGPNIIRAARALHRDCLLEGAGSRSQVKATILRSDARSLPLASEFVDAVITSPPYWNMYDYVGVHRLSYLAFGWRQKIEQQIGRTYGIEKDGNGFIPPVAMRKWYEEKFGGESLHLARSLRDYVTAMRAHFKEVHRVLRPGGVIAYAVGDTTRSGSRFRLVGAFREIIEEAGFQRISIVSRRGSHRRILPAGRNLITGRFTSTQLSASVYEKVIYATKCGNADGVKRKAKPEICADARTSKAG